MATRKLRVEVDALEDRRRRISAVLLEADNVWDVAAQYFLIFRHGLALGTRFTKEAATQFSNQLDFIQAAMTPDVVSSAGLGTEAIMRSWSYSQWFDDVDVELESLQGARSSLTAINRTSVTFTKQTLRNLFPDLCKTGKRSNFADKLLGQRIVMCGSTYFEWDDASGCVSTVIAQSDMLTLMTSLLGGVREVARVFETALICPDFKMR